MAGKGKLENLRPPWRPGESGNRSGRPRRSPISDCYEALAEVRLSKEARDALRLPPEVKRRIKTYGDLLAWAQFRSGFRGKTDAAREIVDRLEDRARQPVDVSGEITVGLAERIERARKASEE